VICYVCHWICKLPEVGEESNKRIWDFNTIPERSSSTKGQSLSCATLMASLEG